MALLHTLFLDGVYVRDDADENAPPVFHPATPPTQEDVQAVVQQAAKRIVRFLQKRGLIALATAPGDGEVTVVVGDETLGDDDPLLAQLSAQSIVSKADCSGPHTARNPPPITGATHVTCGSSWH